MLCVDTCLNTAIPSQRASARAQPWSRSSRTRDSLPEGVRSILKLLIETFTGLEVQIAILDAEINCRSKTDPTACLTIPGVGPVVSTAITALVRPHRVLQAGVILRLGSGSRRFRNRHADQTERKVGVRVARVERYGALRKL